MEGGSETLPENSPSNMYFMSMTPTRQHLSRQMTENQRGDKAQRYSAWDVQTLAPAPVSLCVSLSCKNEWELRPFY